MKEEDMISGDINIRKLLEEGNTMIVCDANVYLHIYAFAQGYCDFAIDCMRIVKDYLIVPAMVEIEFEQHYKKCYKEITNKLKNAENQCNKQLNSARTSIMAACMNLKKMQFPDVDELLANLERKIEEQLAIVKDFFVERKDTLNLVAEKWKQNDFVLELMEEIRDNGQVLEPFTQLELYRLCESGKKRYKNKKPPGYEDNDKDGIRKYGDFIWWIQIIQYAKREKKNLILVTDDVKSDWWNTTEEGKRELRIELINEFHETKQEIYPFVSGDFYDKIAEDYGLDKPDIVQYALELTDEDYCERISEDVFCSVETELIYNAIDYIDEETAHIGDLGIDEFEIDEWSFVKGEQIDRDDDEVMYNLQFEVQLSGDSHNYSGRDEDTREIIESPPAHHVFSGNLEIEICRKADILLDFENESSFEDARIICGLLTETEYEPYVDEWDDYDDYDEYDEDVEIEVCGETFTINKSKDAYTKCSICGEPLSMLNDSGGICYKCYNKYDV